MKLVRFMYNHLEEIGIFSLDETKVIPKSSVLGQKTFSDMNDLIRNIISEEIQKLKSVAKIRTKEYESYNAESIKILSPIEKPVHDIICIGLNYMDHLNEMKDNLEKNHLKDTHKTVCFSKRANRIIGNGDVIKGHFDLDSHIDYEVELAVIIGKKGTRIPRGQAEEFIFGYSIFNDISSRQLQQNHNQWYRGKSIDTYAAMGPCILYKDELSFPIELNISSSVNGEIRQESNTKMLLNDIPSIIEEISNGITLEPGDIIATGTPAGVGAGFNPPKFLQKGDTVVCEIEGIGKLINIVE